MDSTRSTAGRVGIRPSTFRALSPRLAGALIVRTVARLARRAAAGVLAGRRTRWRAATTSASVARPDWRGRSSHTARAEVTCSTRRPASRMRMQKSTDSGP